MASPTNYRGSKPTDSQKKKKKKKQTNKQNPIYWNQKPTNGATKQ